MRKGRRQEVTGLVVNADKPGVSRETRRRLRAALHRATQASAGKPAHWQGQAAQPSQLLGLAQFVYQVDPVQGGPLLGQARQLTRSLIDRANDALLQASRQDRAAARAQATASAQFRRLAASGQAPARASGKTWWQPAEPAAPVIEKTDQQRREQRLQEREAARAQAAAAARPAVDTPQQQPAQAPGPDAQAPGPSPMPGLLAYWAQIVICFLLGTVFQARLITLIGIVLVLLLRYRRIRRWDVFAAAMVVAVLLGLGLRLS